MEDFIRYDVHFHDFLVKEFKKAANIKYFDYDKFVNEYKLKINVFCIEHFIWIISKKYYTCLDIYEYQQSIYPVDDDDFEDNYAEDYYNRYTSSDFWRIAKFGYLISQDLPCFNKYECYEMRPNLLNIKSAKCIIRILDYIYNIYIYYAHTFINEYFIYDISDIIIEYI